MASIRRRSHNSFLLTVELGYDGQGKRIRRTKTIRVYDEKLLRTKTRLNDYLNTELYKFKAKVEAGEYVSPEKLEFKSFVDDWLNKHAKVNLEKTTIKNYQVHIKNYILPRFGNMQLDKIKAIHVVNFLNDISQPGAAVSGRKEALSDSSIYEIDKTLRVLFDKAVEWQILKSSPMALLKRPKVRKKEMKYYDEADVIKFMIAMYEEHITWRMFFITSALSGMRKAEVFGLQWSDIDFENKCIVLKRSLPMFINGNPYIKGTKTNEDERIIYMPDWYMLEMLEFKEFWDAERFAAGNKWEGKENQFLFHSGFGKPYTPNSANKIWDRIKKDHELSDIRIHDLRHTMITYLLNSGEPVFNVSKRAGHSNTKTTTEIYGHSDKMGQKSAIKHFEKFNPELLVDNRSTDTIFNGLDENKNVDMIAFKAQKNKGQR